MMADFDLMELAPEQEDIAYLHHQLFSTATEVVGAGAEEPAIVLNQTAAATVSLVHDGKYANGNTVPEPPQDDKPAVVNHGEGEALVGRSIVKKFKRTKFSGKVTAYDSECKWYKVIYEDGDEEELEYKELGPLLVEAAEAEAVKAANVKKRANPETDSDSKSPSKKARGRKPASEKKSAKPKAEKKPKAPKSPKSPKAVTPQKPSPKKADEAKQATGDAALTTPQTTGGEKRGRGRPKKDASSKSASKTKADGKGSGDSSSEIKPSTRQAAAVPDVESKSPRGRSPRAKAAGASPSPGGSLSKQEGVQLIGIKIKKKFNGEWYDGEVIGYDPKVGFYKIRYSDGDFEELELKEVRKSMVDDGQITPKTRGRSSLAKDTTSPAKSSEKSPQKKQKVSPPKKGDAKVQSPARDGAQPKKRGRPVKAKSVAEASDDQDKSSGEAKASSDEDCEESGDDDPGLSRDKRTRLPQPEGPRPPSPLVAVRYAGANNANALEYYGCGEVVGSVKTRCAELAAISLQPTTSPIVHLSVSQHHLAILTATGHVLVWRNQHGNIRTGCGEWEFVSDLESKGVVLIDIAGPDVDRKTDGYGPQEEDQVPDPFYLVAVTCTGEDYPLQGSHPQEHVGTQRLSDNPKLMGLRATLSQINPSSVESLGLVVQASMGTVEAFDETPFVGYITDANEVYIRSATCKVFIDEVNLVTGYTGKPLKIKCGGAYHAILLTDDGRSWTWGRGYCPSTTSELVSSSKRGKQSPYSTCHQAHGTLVGRKVMDVGCYREDFVALTRDGAVHHWTHGVANPAADIYNVPSTPAAGLGPSVAEGDKLKSVSMGVGVCAGVTELGKVHTWRALWRGAPVGLQGPGTPLGRQPGIKTVVPSLGAKFAIQVMCVAGSLVVIVEKKPRAKPGSEN